MIARYMYSYTPTELNGWLPCETNVVDDTYAESTSQPVYYTTPQSNVDYTSQPVYYTTTPSNTGYVEPTVQPTYKSKQVGRTLSNWEIRSSDKKGQHYIVSDLEEGCGWETSDILTLQVYPAYMDVVTRTGSRYILPFHTARDSNSTILHFM